MSYGVIRAAHHANASYDDLPVIDACPADSVRRHGCDKVGTGATG